MESLSPKAISARQLLLEALGLKGIDPTHIQTITIRFDPNEVGSVTIKKSIYHEDMKRVNKIMKQRYTLAIKPEAD